MPKTDLRASSILVIDDRPQNVALLEEILLLEGYSRVVSTTDSRCAAEMCARHAPDLLILDLHMPVVSGFEILKHLRDAGPDLYFPILVITGDSGPDAKREALSLGAKDFVSKPFERWEVTLRVRNLLETQALYKQAKIHNETLEKRVTERTQQLAAAQIELLQHLASAAEYRDDDTGRHTQRVGLMSARIARTLGQSDADVELLRLAAPLHDIGKIGVPDHIFAKPGKLTAGEMEIMRSHTRVGAEILAHSNFGVLRLAREIALYHHERWDGTGYPQRLQAEQIPVSARIVAVADVFDALVHDRPYKKAWKLEEALAEIRSQRGRHFDPAVVDAFLPTATPTALELLSDAIETEQSGVVQIGMNVRLGRRYA